MPLTEFVFGSPILAKVGVVTFDASVSESHRKSATVTSFPVEEGSTISDHIILQPDTLQINGMVTNHPLVYLASLNSPSPLDGDLTPVDDRVELAFAELERIMGAGETVDVVTSFKEYTSMAIEGVEVTRDVERGNVLDASISLKRINIATLETVEIPEPAVASNKAVKDKGKKPPKPATDQAADAAKQRSAIFGGLS